MDDSIKKAAVMLTENLPGVALTGAGISVESGIPDFRSPGGLWERFDPMEYATINAFTENPEKIWKMLIEMEGVVAQAEPNPAHTALAELEKMGLLSSIVTQNIDGLHQKAGSKKVVEFHGNAGRLICLEGCGRWPADDFRSHKQTGTIPRCPECATILKPDVVFFGEPIPPEALTHSFELVQNCRVMLVVGTSATVAPASNLPLLARQMGADVLEFNLEPTVLSPLVAQSIIGSASETLAKLVDAARDLQTG